MVAYAPPQSSSRRGTPLADPQVRGSFDPVDEKEAYQVLLARAERKTGSIPATLLVEHCLSVTSDADWPVQREAMEALLRRLGFGWRDELTIASRPPNRSVFGLYTTRRKRSSARPYQTVLRSVAPLAGSCDCPDFLRSSLGICKHILVVLEDIASKPRRFEIARRQSAESSGPPVLSWDPVRPLLGGDDPLSRVRWDNDGIGHRVTARLRKLRRRFRSDGETGLVLRERELSDPSRRFELIKELLRVATPRTGSTVNHDPALVGILRHERSRLEQARLQDIDRRTLGALLRTLRRKLYPYQREGVERFIAAGRLLLADDMGLGKTAQAIASCHVVWRSGIAKRGLIVVPASLKSQWEREWMLFSDTPITIVDGGPSERQATYESHKRGFLIVNYEQVIRDVDAILSWRPDIVVLDEAQRIKNWATKTAACVKAIQPPYRLVLTGTPMENRLEELASILDWVDDFALEPKWRLLPWHSTFADGRREVSGARNLDTLRARLSGCMLRRLRTEVLDQLPPRTDIRVPVEMTDEQAEEHDALNQPIASIVQRAAKRPLTQAEFLKLMQLLTMQRIISNGIAQMEFEDVWPEISERQPTDTRMRSLYSPKLIELRELIHRLAVDQKRKVVVFSQWRRMLRLANWSITDVLTKAGIHSVFFTGQEKQKRRTQNIVEFHDDPSTRILFASDAGGVGLNLQRASNCCINLELPWNPAVLEQRIGRIYRLGQKRPVDAFNLVTDTGIENRIAGLVDTKQAFFKSLFDGDSDTVGFDSAGSFISRIEKIVEMPKVEVTEDSEDASGEGTARERELEEMLARADESRDRDPSALETTDDERTSGGGGTRPADGEARPAQASVGDLFSRLTIERRTDGGIHIDAPPDAASALGDLFEGMARLMRDATAR